MTYGEARIRATAMILEGAVAWAAEDVARMMEQGLSREEAIAAQNAHATEIKECIAANVGKLVRMMLEPRAPSRLQ